ncbi:hypothetical protein NWF32_26635 [Pseudomonas qingdaonensis]|nr:hypothetical protein [Pseudomonas qingdaonensis]
MPLENLAVDDSLLEAAPARVTDAQACAVLRQQFGLSGTLEKLGGERDLNFRVMLEDGSSRLFKLSHPLENPDVVDFTTRRCEESSFAIPGLRFSACTPRLRASTPPSSRSTGSACWRGCCPSKMACPFTA